MGPNYDEGIKHKQGILMILLASLSLFAFIIGLAGYQANFIQLGLDQLFEAPSQYLGLFIHYAIWAFQAGSLPFIPIVFLTECSHDAVTKNVLALCCIILYALSMGVLLLIGW